MPKSRWSQAVTCRAGALAIAAAIFVTGTTSLAPSTNAAEFGSSPYPKGFSDIFAGIVPTAPGLYALNDVYHYQGSVGATVFNGNVQLGVDAKTQQEPCRRPSAPMLPISFSNCTAQARRGVEARMGEEAQDVCGSRTGLADAVLLMDLVTASR